MDVIASKASGHAIPRKAKMNPKRDRESVFLWGACLVYIPDRPLGLQEPRMHVEPILDRELQPWMS